MVCLTAVISCYGGASSELSLILDLLAALKLARRHTVTKISDSEEVRAMSKQKLEQKCGRVIARGWATLLLNRSRDTSPPSFVGGNSFSLQDY